MSKNKIKRVTKAEVHDAFGSDRPVCDILPAGFALDAALRMERMERTVKELQEHFLTCSWAALAAQKTARDCQAEVLKLQRVMASRPAGKAKG